MDKRRNTYDRVRKKGGIYKRIRARKYYSYRGKQNQKIFLRISPIKIQACSEIIPQIPSRKLSAIPSL